MRDAESPADWRAFSCTISGSRVEFCAGAVDRIDGELARLGIVRALIVTTAGRLPLAERIASPRIGGMHVCAGQHVLVDDVNRAMTKLARIDADGLVAIGGGAAIGEAKALARRHRMPLILVPTTYAGSEMTAAVGETSDAGKHIFTDEAMRARTIVYDPALTMTLPVGTAIASGLNALAHAIGCLRAPRDPASAAIAAKAAPAMFAALTALVDDPASVAARTDALAAAFMCGLCLGGMRLTRHHRLCHLLGGRAALPHAETHAILLPYTLGQPGRPDRSDMDFARAIQALARRAGVPRSLEAAGLSSAALADVTAAGKVDRDGRGILAMAFAGTPIDADAASGSCEGRAR